MATAKKKSIPKAKDENIYYCVGCGKVHRPEEFYISYHLYHANGKLPFCKKFIKNKVYKSDDSVDVEKFKTLLMQLDLPFLQEIYDKTLESGSDPVGNYFRMINALPQYKEMTWKDGWDISIEEEIERILADEDRRIDITKPTNKMTRKELLRLKERWGFDYDIEELYLFEKKYMMLKDNYSERTAMHTEALFNYVRYRVKEEMATAKGLIKEAKEWGDLANKAAVAAKINPSQLSKADLSDGLSTFSELSQAVEREVDVIRILPRFKYRPNDAIDFNLYCYINYERKLAGLPPITYEEVYSFYDKSIKDYVDQYGDPYEIFKDDPALKNRDKIKRFIQVDDNIEVGDN